jgi:hypothetical protein
MAENLGKKVLILVGLFIGWGVLLDAAIFQIWNGILFYNALAKGYYPEFAIAWLPDIILGILALAVSVIFLVLLILYIFARPKPH